MLFFFLVFNIFSSEDQLEEQASKDTLLVPILIDIDVDTFKIRDAFVWNVNGELIISSRRFESSGTW